MRTKLKNYLPALACALIPILCYLLIRPYAEIGIDDDWSYIKTAQILAQTGHIAYNGWATAMLGWQLYFGAFFVKLFGFSFTAVRFSTAIEAVVTAFLLQRTCLLAGLNSWNAALATLTFVLSPLYVPMVCTFMTDVSGVLCVVVCLYMCLRAAQTQNARSAAVWIRLAALVNAVGGTARQIAWLGVLVMVPSTLWLLRRNRRVLVVGCISWIAGAVMVAASMHWFAKQPYALPESPALGRIDLRHLRLLAGMGLQCFGALTLWALPVLLTFTAFLRTWNRRTGAVFAAGFLFFAVAEVAMVRAGNKFMWLSSLASDYMVHSTLQRLGAILVQGTHLSMADGGFCLLLVYAMLLSVLGLGACLFGSAHGHPAPQPAAIAISWHKLGTILGPFSLAYIALLVPRAMLAEIFGRYMLPLLAFSLLVLARCYQERVKTNLPRACVFLIVLFGGLGVAGAHDGFALYRGYVTAIEEIRSSGVPATAIAGPWEFEGWTQIEKAGHVNDGPVRVAQGAYELQPAPVLPANCTPWRFGSLESMPALQPAYAVSLNPRDCGGQVAYPPVTYRTWIAPRVNTIYAVRLPPSFPTERLGSLIEPDPEATQHTRSATAGAG